MRRVMCGKGTMAYQNVGIGQSHVMCKVGSPGGGGGHQQQGWDGASMTATLKAPAAIASRFHHEADSAAAAWNIITLSMFIRAQSPDSLLRPASNCTFEASSEGGTRRSSLSFGTSPSSSHSGFDRTSSCGADLETRSGGDSDDNKEDGRLQPKGIADNGSQNLLLEISSADSSSSDEGKSGVPHFRGQVQGEENARLANESCGARADTSSRYLAGEIPARDSSGSHMGGPELSSSSSSSIGGCDDISCSSDEASNECCWGEMEVESAPRDGPLHSMNALEDSLPIKRGLSRFWNGKAKSFRSLSDVSSIEQLVKPENPYAKRRRIATFAQRHRSFPPLSRTSTAGISKRPTSTLGSRSGLAIAVAMGSKLEEAERMDHNPSSAAAAATATATATATTSFFSGRSVSLTDLAKRP